MTTPERYKRVLQRFALHMPVVATELHYDNPYQLLVAVILSAQCTDKRINTVTPAFFQAFPTPQALAQATPEAVFDKIKSVSYPNNKTKSLLGMARRLVDQFGGNIPADREQLMTLPGVGRKTANVILAVLYGQPVMAVDTHVFRVADRIGLTTHSHTPLDTEQQLTAHIPPAIIPDAHHWLILHGRYVCTARSPHCTRCFLADLCRYHNNNNEN